MLKKGFFFFFKRSIAQRKGRVAIAALAVALAVAVITGMVGLTMGIRDKLGRELKSYGANVMVSPLKGDFLIQTSLKRISDVPGVEDSSGQVFGLAVYSGQPIEFIGLELQKAKELGWRVSGGWPAAPGEVLAGVNLKNALKLKAGARVVLTMEQRVKEFVVSGFIEKGGPEDSAFIMSLPDAWGLLGFEGGLSAIMVRGRSGQLEQVVEGLKKAVPSSTVKPLRQVAMAEESLLGKIQLLMTLITVVVLFATAISVASTMGANVLERRQEIGLMKALGATMSDIGWFYRAEAILIGVAGGASGFVLGLAAGQAISKGAFGAFVEMPIYLVFISVATGAALSLLAGFFPVRNAMKYNPAVILRGE